MAITTAFISAVMNIFGSPSNDNQPEGANAVREAIYESEGLGSGKTAILGEPDITMNEQTFFNDPKVIVPIYECPFDCSSKLVFDLPKNRDDEHSQLFELLEVLDADFDTMEEISGEEVPVVFVGGNAVIDWAEIEDTENNGSDKGESDNNDDGDGAGSPVNVQETTVSGGEGNDV
jgi:hypothetical protein